DVDTVIYALGTMANPIIARSTPTLKTDARGYIEVDRQTQMTSIPGVFAGGDIAKTPGTSTTVIHAMQTGRRAAQGILNYISQKTDK
ncbi:dihydropyrimidine dehydrogenase subunit A, partial [Candidatus Magnetobacterium bavaricum]